MLIGGNTVDRKKKLQKKVRDRETLTREIRYMSNTLIEDTFEHAKSRFSKMELPPPLQQNIHSYYCF